MKKNISKIFVLILAVVSFAACKSDDMNFKDAKVTEVTQLYTPTDGDQLNLSNQTSANLYFSWAPASVADGGAPLYEVLFDKVGGNFSNPIYILTSDNNGYNSGATIPHSLLNTIMSFAGVGSGETGGVIWTVRSSRGINQVLAPVSRELTLTRYFGFDNIPSELFITGDGTEAGTNINDAIQMVKLEDGKFEIYTELKTGAYKFIDAASGTPREFYINTNNVILEETGSTPVSTPGIYRITLDFNAASMVATEIVNLGYFYCNAGSIQWNLSYQGKGVWTGSGASSPSTTSDDRYRFNANTVTNGGTSAVELWGPATRGLDGVPSTAAQFQIAVYTVAEIEAWKGASEVQWWPKWKLASDYKGVTVNVTVDMSASPYHLVISK